MDCGTRAGVMLGLTATARADETTLIFATTSRRRLRSYAAAPSLADKINRQGKGVLRIDTRDGSTLAKSHNYYDRINDECGAIAWGQLSISPASSRVSGVLTLPFVADNSEIASVAFWRLYKSGLLDAEFGTSSRSCSRPAPGRPPYGKAPPSLDNLNGLKVTIVATRWVIRWRFSAGRHCRSQHRKSTNPSTRRGYGRSYDLERAHDFKLQEVTTSTSTPARRDLGHDVHDQEKNTPRLARAAQNLDANSGEAEAAMLASI